MELDRRHQQAARHGTTGHELPEAEWNWVQSINVKRVFFCAKRAILLLQRASGGSISSLSSIYGLVGGLAIPAYYASKGAVRIMTRCKRSSLSERRQVRRY
ncbi:MAG: SDR family NAD(P)-dependent oxidoreductase [Hyphomonadaceae bacterium]